MRRSYFVMFGSILAIGCAVIAFVVLSSPANLDPRYRVAVDLVRRSEANPESVEIDAVYFGRPRGHERLVCVRYRSTDQNGVRKLRSRVVNVAANGAAFYGDYEWLTRMGPDALPNEWSLNPRHFDRR